MTISCECCGAVISDERISKMYRYAYDTGFNEGYETAMSEREECEMYVIDGKVLQCGNCGALVVGVVDEGEAEED